MRLQQSSEVDLAAKRRIEELHGTGSELGRKYWAAMAMYGVLALLVWFTMDASTVSVFGRPVEMRLVPLIIIGSFALRTVVMHQAEKVRRSGDGKNS